MEGYPKYKFKSPITWNCKMQFVKLVILIIFCALYPVEAAAVWDGGWVDGLWSWWAAVWDGGWVDGLWSW
jgi:hypothetical protein